MKIMDKHCWLALFSVFLLTAFSIPTESQAEVSIPDWLRSNAGWWASGQIDDSDFVLGIEFMIKEGIIQVPQTETQENVQSIIPDWIKTSACDSVGIEKAVRRNTMNGANNQCLLIIFIILFYTFNLFSKTQFVTKLEGKSIF